MDAIPFHTTDWEKVPATVHPGETGVATWRTLMYGDLRVRMVEYSPGYRADHWCRKGHLLFCIEGNLKTELSDGSQFELSKGMSYQVSDEMSEHKSVTERGAKLIIIDGGFLSVTQGKVEILDYRPEHQPAFEKLNREWIEQYFEMEEVDHQVLRHPDIHILMKGGRILMAAKDGHIVGTVALRYHAPGVLEFTKMAVDKTFQGKKIGRALGEAAIVKARQLGASKIILYSNTRLESAIQLYFKLGFKEVPVDGPYKRSNIKMELLLSSL